MANFKTYLEESYNELVHKVSWPTWRELQSSAIVVLVAALIISLIVFLMDFVFGVQNMSNDGFWKGLLGFIYKMIG
ncbi:MAG: preprotein translocase subunit SecE [Flavobacteriales bacterium]|nr:preprotein translocase subunit SecE [Flavobacteriales bacterium]MCB0784026.1 preprotein translocase subunit SecE [Flavobacteriales bacterium]MCB0788099.1 preprotein translocase subunit SecE [Flavobacteriales bacterium]MCB0807908.1 preprotein translocase subunit SecE [Flavobacteriales bacterium]MCB0813093.1 preprotein translocase subunit SecE [Flavobacteriales bacterium]